MRRLPQHHVPEQRGSGGQVARDRGEVERGDGEHESLERAVLHPVPRAGRRRRLLGQQPPGEVDVVPPEVDQLAGGVDLRLVDRLGLAQHRRSVDRRAPGPGQQFGRLEEDGGAVVEGQFAPSGRGQAGRLDRGRDVFVGGLADLAEPVCVVVRHGDVEPLAATHSLDTADRHRQVNWFPGQLFQLGFQGEALGATRRVGLDCLVRGNRNTGDGIEHGSLLLRWPPLAFTSHASRFP